MTEPAWNPMRQAFDAPPVTLAEFLLARIAEDEALARHSARSSWGADWTTVDNMGRVLLAGGPQDGRWVERLTSISAVGDGGWLIFRSSSGQPETDASHDMSRHIARHDPARVLAECEAKRRLIDHAFAFGGYVDDGWGDGCSDADLRAGACTDRGGRAVEEVLRLLALPVRRSPRVSTGVEAVSPPDWRRVTCPHCGREGTFVQWRGTHTKGAAPELRVEVAHRRRCCTILGEQAQTLIAAMRERQMVRNLPPVASWSMNFYRADGPSSSYYEEAP